MAKSKWMTETRDNFRKFTDSPKKIATYIGNNMILPKRLANIYENHYLSSYKKYYGENEPEDNDEQFDEGEEEKVETDQPKTSKLNKKEPSGVRSRSRSRSPKTNQGLGPKKQKKVDFKRLIYERNKAKYGKPMIDKSKLSKEERKELERLEKEITMSRWNPDTHLLSVHGKPIFHPYGKGNTNPTVGGIVYGQYMLTHNIHPHSGDNKPLYQQVYESAHNQAFENGKRTLVPTKGIPADPEVPVEVLEELKNRNPTMPGLSSKHLKRHVKQLDLLQEPCFASKHTISAPTGRSDGVKTTEKDFTPHKILKAEQFHPKNEVKKAGKAKENTSKPRGFEQNVEQIGAFSEKSKPVSIAATPVVLNVKDTNKKIVGDLTSKSMGKTMASTGKNLNQQLKAVAKPVEAQPVKAKPAAKPEVKPSAKPSGNTKNQQKTISPIPGPIAYDTDYGRSDQKENNARNNDHSDW